jgi:hypothetical protein
VVEDGGDFHLLATTRQSLVKIMRCKHWRARGSMAMQLIKNSAPFSAFNSLNPRLASPGNDNV